MYKKIISSKVSIKNNVFLPSTVIINILLVSSVVYVYGAPFDKSEWLSAIRKLKRERNLEEENPLTWLHNWNTEKSASNSDYLQWLLRNSKHRDVKQSDKKHEKHSIPLNLLHTKNKSDSSDRSDSEQSELILFRKKDTRQKNSNEEESVEKKSGELSIRKRNSDEEYSREQDSHKRKSDGNRRRKKDRLEKSSAESWSLTDESDSSDSSSASSSDKSNKKHQKRRESNSIDRKKKDDWQGIDGDKSSSSSSSSESSSDSSSSEEDFEEYLKKSLNKKKNYEEIKYILKHYKTNVQYRKLYEWNRRRYLEWKRKIDLKKKIIKAKKNLHTDKLMSICNILEDSDQHEDQIRKCVRDYLSTKDEFIFVTDLSLIRLLSSDENKVNKSVEIENESGFEIKVLIEDNSRSGDDSKQPKTVIKTIDKAINGSELWKETETVNVTGNVYIYIHN